MSNSERRSLGSVHGTHVPRDGICKRISSVLLSIHHLPSSIVGSHPQCERSSCEPIYSQVLQCSNTSTSYLAPDINGKYDVSIVSLKKGGIRDSLIDDAGAGLQRRDEELSWYAWILESVTCSIPWGFLTCSSTRSAAVGKGKRNLDQFLGGKRVQTKWTKKEDLTVSRCQSSPHQTSSASDVQHVAVAEILKGPSTLSSWSWRRLAD